jgi:ApeA N-terminal domain 1
MLEALFYERGLATSAASSTYKIGATSNFMLLGKAHFSDEKSVKRLTFSSSIIQHVFRLYPDVSSAPRVITSHGFRRRVYHKLIVSYVNFKHRVRFRIFRSILPSIGIEPTSTLMVDFYDAITPSEALKFLYNFRQLMTVICGGLIDLWNVNILLQAENRLSDAELYFADIVEKPDNSTHFPVSPLINITKDQGIFARVLSKWLDEPELMRISRGAFGSIISDRGFIRPGHLKDLITLVEMRQGTRGSKPLDKATSKKLRNKLIETLEQFAIGQENSECWIDLMRARIERINSYDTTITVINFIENLPEGFVETESSFPKDVTQLRHALTHELTRFTAKDQSKLNYYITKLKALFVLNDAISLGASQEEISPVSAFFVAAKYPFHSYDDDTVDEEFEDKLETE